MKSRRIFSAALAALLLLPALAACAAQTPAAADTTAPTAVTTAPAAETTAVPETTSPYDLSDYIPADLRFDGEEIRFLDTNDSGPNGKYWATYGIFAEALSGDVMNDAVFSRNLWLQERFGVTVTERQVSKVPDEIARSINAQTDEFDAVLGNQSQMASMTTNRYLYELGEEVPYLDFTKSWWDQKQIAGMSIGGKIYYATGDLIAVDDDATFAVMFNKDMAKDYQLGDLYALVDEGKWTMDQMHNLMTQVAGDINGDGKMDWGVDRYGLSGGKIIVEAFFYGAGLTQTKKDADDLPVLALDVDKTTSFIEKAYPLASDPELCFDYSYHGGKTDDAKEVFASGRGLFYAETLQGVTRLRSSEVNFGVIPFPKWDEKQEAYLSFQHVVGAAIGVPITNQRLEMTGAVIESMAAKGQELLTPAYYDLVLIGRGLRDAESEPMVELILANRVYDLGYVYGWSKLQTSINDMVQNNRPGIASAMKANEKLFTMNLKKTLEAIGVEG